MPLPLPLPTVFVVPVVVVMVFVVAVVVMVVVLRPRRRRRPAPSPSCPPIHIPVAPVLLPRLPSRLLPRAPCRNCCRPRRQACPRGPRAPRPRCPPGAAAGVLLHAGLGHDDLRGGRRRPRPLTSRPGLQHGRHLQGGQRQAAGEQHLRGGTPAVGPVSKEEGRGRKGEANVGRDGRGAGWDGGETDGDFRLLWWPSSACGGVGNGSAGGDGVRWGNAGCALRRSPSAVPS